jgi:hypothetical protein
MRHPGAIALFDWSEGRKVGGALPYPRRIQLQGYHERSEGSSFCRRLGVASSLGNLNCACATACDAFAKDVEFSGKTLLARAGWLIDRLQAVLHPPEFSGKLIL